MKFSENWLRELVDMPADRDTLVQRLTMAGLEVESVEKLGLGLGEVVVAEIIECEKHPNADKLKVCKVAIGQVEPLTIVCGAPNARPGLKAPVALVGAKLPNGIEIKKAALRGVESSGMLCSAKELGLDADASGLMELPQNAPTGRYLTEYLELPDASIEIKMTPNRPDCLSLRGLAYDVAALFDTMPPPLAIFNTVVPSAGLAQREIRLQAGGDCPRYLGRVIEGIDLTAQSPLYIAERLRRAGLRPISAVVDATNYVMLELGQPLHAFDNAKLNGVIVVRRARAGETLKLLDSNETTLDPECLVIADDKGVLSLAGVMGGYDSRVTEITHDIFLESAHFTPSVIMGRARKFGLHTDASHRFERGVDPELPRMAIERVTQLLMEIAGGKPGPVVEAVLAEHLPKRAPVRLRQRRLAQLSGLSIADAEVERILTTLGFVVERAEDGWRATPPSRRFDIDIEEDLIEEVVRVYGYERVPTHPPRGELMVPALPEGRVDAGLFQRQLAARDYVEAVCFAFLAPETLKLWQLDQHIVKLTNPLSAELAVMRTSLLPGLVTALISNRRRQQERVRLFELGRVFHAVEDGPIESVRLAAAACGSALAEQWSESKRLLDFFDLKGDVESLFALTGEAAKEFRFEPSHTPYLHPGRSACVWRGDEIVGFVGALHPRLLKALAIEEDVHVFELDMSRLAIRPLPHAVELSHYPSVRRDIAVVLPEDVTYTHVEETIREAVGSTLTQLFLFDRYTGENLGAGVKSLAMGLILQNQSRTLTDHDADHCVAAAVAALERSCNARLRG